MCGLKRQQRRKHKLGDKEGGHIKREIIAPQRLKGFQEIAPNSATVIGFAENYRALLTKAAIAVILCMVMPYAVNFLFKPVTLREEMSEAHYPFNDVYGVYAPEIAGDGTTFRWTNGHAIYTFPYAGNAGRYAELDIRLTDNRQSDQTPALVTIKMNGQPVTQFVADRRFTVYNARVDTQQSPSPYLFPADIQVEIESETVIMPNDPRQLGVVLDWIALTPERGQREIIWQGVVCALALMVVILIAAIRLGYAWSILFGLLTLSSQALLLATYIPRILLPVVELSLIGLGWVAAVILAPKKIPVVGLILGLIMLWMVSAGRILGDWQVDDAYISYRYAWNLVHGYGLVFNVGEVVEGYTNFLWTLLAGGAIALGLHPSNLTLTANILSAMGLVSLAYYMGMRLVGREGSSQVEAGLWPFVPVGLLAVDTNLMLYGARGSGIEEITFALLLLVGMALLWLGPGQQRYRACWVIYGLGGISLALASLTRPEGIPATLALFGLRAWQDYRAGKDLKSMRLALAYVLPYLAVVLPYQVWRVTFYGYPFPNTFYAKTGATTALISRGLEYAWEFTKSQWLAIGLCILGLAVMTSRWLWNKYNNRSMSRVIGGSDTPAQLRIALVILVVGFTVYIIWVGGDWFPGQRFFVPIMPMLALLAQEGARTLLNILSRPGIKQEGKVSKTLAWVLPAALGVAMAGYGMGSIRPQLTDGSMGIHLMKEVVGVTNGSAAGLWLRDSTSPQTTTAAGGIGAMAYYSQRQVIDFYGLTDLHIGHLKTDSMGTGIPGHEKSDPAYVLSKHPHYIWQTWAYYFDPVAEQLSRDYVEVVYRSPTGPMYKWLKWKGVAEP